MMRRNQIHMELFPAIIPERGTQSICEKIGLLVVLGGGIDVF